MCSPKPIFEDFSMVKTRVSTKWISALCSWGYHWGLGGESFSILGSILSCVYFKYTTPGWTRGFQLFFVAASSKHTRKKWPWIKIPGTNTNKKHQKHPRKHRSHNKKTTTLDRWSHFWWGFSIIFDLPESIRHFRDFLGLSNETNPGCLRFIGDEILPSYLGIITNKLYGSLF